MMTDNAIIAAILGKPTFASLVVSESVDFTSLQSTFPAASYTGRMAMATVGTVKVMMISNGTEWVPEGGQATLALSGIGYGIMPSGTVSAGESGHFVSGTALPHTYSAGLWMYFAANAIVTPNISAGFYWCVFSSTTTCTIYENGPGSAAINFSVGGATTGYTGGEVTARGVLIPGGLMGEGGQLATDINNSIPGNTNNKIVRLKIGGTTCLTNSSTGATILSVQGNGTTTNQGSGVQMSRGAFGVNSAFQQVMTTIDTSAETTYALTLQMAVATDYIINNSFRLDLFKV